MGFITKEENIRLAVRADAPFGGFKDARSEVVALERIQADILRHVDDVFETDIQLDRVLYCEHCGSDWTEGRSSSHNGGCCEKDEQIMDIATS